MVPQDKRISGLPDFFVGVVMNNPRAAKKKQGRQEKSPVNDLREQEYRDGREQTQRKKKKEI